MTISKSIIWVGILIVMSISACTANSSKPNLRFATFNVSIEATNYISRNAIAENPARSKVVKDFLASGNQPQIKNIAEIIQRTRPDILLLNEFDYIVEPNEGIEPFIKNYLNVSQNGESEINYPYYYIAEVNTGLVSPYDLDNDGNKGGIAGDAQGFGYYPGQYGMALLSRYPIKSEQVRSLRTFLWKDMPDALQPINEDGSRWYSSEEWSNLRLSSKSHWDIPIETDAGTINVIAAHPTPPTFDGPEDRNGKRNHDEIRLINDYLSNAQYLIDDERVKGGLKENSRFVVMGDLNSSPDEGDSIKSAIRNLLDHPKVDSSCIPSSAAGKLSKPASAFSAQHTAAWGLQVDYVLPSKSGLSIQKCGMFWPTKDDSSYPLIATRKASSDHRLVWLDLVLE